MASYTVSTSAHELNMKEGVLASLELGVTKVWKGDIAVFKSDGWAYSAYATGAAGDSFAGVFAETVDNTGGSAGDLEATAYQRGVFRFNIASGAQANVGVQVYHERGATGTPRTVTVTAGTHGFVVGKVVKLISATEVDVEIVSPAASVIAT